MCCSKGLDVRLYLQRFWQVDENGDDDDDDDGQEGTSGAVKLYLQQMSQLLLLTVIWLSLQLTNYLAGKHLYLTTYHSFTFVFVYSILLYLYLYLYLHLRIHLFYTFVLVFDQISFLYFCPCLHLSKYTVFDAPYFRKGHSHNFTCWRQTNASESKSKYVAQTQTRVVAFNICDKDLKSPNTWMHCALSVYIRR